MTTPHTLLSHLTLFCRRLRDETLLIGPQETADAFRALSLVNIIDRTRGAGTRTDGTIEFEALEQEATR